MRKRDVIAILSIMLFTPVLLTVLVQPHMTGTTIERAREASFAKVSFAREVASDGTVTQKIDASEDKWVYYSFESGLVPSHGEALPEADWELALKRKKIVSNSGSINRSGSVGIINLGERDFSQAVDVPSIGFILNTAEDGNIVNKGIDKWYRYDIWKHIMTSRDNLYLIKTSDGRVVKMKIDEYYCGNKISACYTIRYAWENV